MKTTSTDDIFRNSNPPPLLMHHNESSNPSAQVHFEFPAFLLATSFAILHDFASEASERLCMVLKPRGLP